MNDTLVPVQYFGETRGGSRNRHFFGFTRRGINTLVYYVYTYLVDWRTGYEQLAYLLSSRILFGPSFICELFVCGSNNRSRFRDGMDVDRVVTSTKG